MVLGIVFAGVLTDNTTGVISVSLDQWCQNLPSVEIWIDDGFGSFTSLILIDKCH